ncbi:cache domain-containing protein [Methylobacterium sp. Gmos1]
MSVNSDGSAGTTFGTRQVLLALVAAVAACAIGLLTGVGQYASARRAVADDAENRAARFEAVFREASEARLQALRLGVEVLARDEGIVEAFRRRDRAELARRTVPLYEQVLKPRFGVTVFDFPGTDGTMFFRAHRADLFGDSVAERAMVTATLKSRITVAGLEIGRSGPELRAMTPVVAGEALIGALELGSSPWDALQIAAQATGLDFAFAMDRRTAELLDRVRGSADLAKGDVLYIRTSKPGIRDLLAGAAFDPGAAGAMLLASEGREIFLRTIPVPDASRQPVTRVTVVEDLTEGLSARRTTIVLYTGLATLVLLGLILTGIFQFRALRARLEESFAGRLQEVRSKALAYDRMNHTLRDLQGWKLGILSELVLVVRNPLAAVQGALDAARPRAGASPEIAFAAGEIGRLNAAFDDHVKMLAMRDRLQRIDVEPVDFAAMLAELLDESGSYDRIAIAALPPVAGNAALLRAAFRALVHALPRRANAVGLSVEAWSEGAAVSGLITGTGAWAAGPPALDEAVAFASGLGPRLGESLVLARLTIEGFGGALALVDEDPRRIGFSFTLRSA